MKRVGALGPRQHLLQLVFETWRAHRALAPLTPAGAGPPHTAQVTPAPLSPRRLGSSVCLQHFDAADATLDVAVFPSGSLTKPSSKRRPLLQHKVFSVATIIINILREQRKVGVVVISMFVNSERVCACRPARCVVTLARTPNDALGSAEIPVEVDYVHNYSLVHGCVCFH